MINYKEMFRPYTIDGHTLEAAMRYWQKVAATKGIKPEVMELAINTVFNQIASGHAFPLDCCPCGCGIDKAATALIHEVERVMVAIDDDIQIQTVDLLQGRFDAILNDHMNRRFKPEKVEIVVEDEPDEEIEEIEPDEEIVETRLPITERSPVLRTLIKIAKEFKRGP